MTSPLILPYGDVEPRFHGTPIRAGDRSAVLGRATIGTECWLDDSTLIRADGHFVQIGAAFHLGHRSTVHIAHDVFPAIIGDRVTVGRNAVVHACTVGNDCVIGDDVVILDGSVVEDGVLIEAGSTVFPRSHLSAGFVYSGAPAKPLRELSGGELAEAASNLRAAAAGPSGLRPARPTAASGLVFAAATARIDDNVRAGAASSVFFGCDLDAGEAGIVIGENTNIQDNSDVRSSTIGRDTTIGHNVRLHDCRVGERTLIGIGAHVERGTIVQDEVLLAAGAVTSPGQVLESGWVWGGRPARPLARLDASKRDMMASIVATYCEYARNYRDAQRNLAERVSE